MVFADPLRNESVALSLATELAKGGHFYDVGRIREQLSSPTRPLLNNMKRFFLDEFSPIADAEPDVTARVHRLIQDAAAGRIREADYTTEFWNKAVSKAQQQIQSDLLKFGPFESLVLVERRETAPVRSYRYVFDFAKARVLGRYVVNPDGKVSLFQSEAVEWRPGVTVGTN